MQAPQPIDLDHLERYTLGDTALEVEILQLFVGQIPSILDRLSVEAPSKDWADAAHTLKGSARAVGAWAVAELAANAEQLPCDPDGREALRARLHLAIDDVRGFLSQRSRSAGLVTAAE